MAFNITNLTTPVRPQYVVTQQHFFSVGEIMLILGLFAILTFWYIEVSKNREKYEHWKNPRGKEKNLYLIVRILFRAYVILVILLSFIAIFILPR